MLCKSCGCTMVGDGYTSHYVCENISDSKYIFDLFFEPDAEPLYCSDLFLVQKFLLESDSTLDLKSALKTYHFKDVVTEAITRAEIENLLPMLNIKEQNPPIMLIMNKLGV